MLRGSLDDIDDEDEEQPSAVGAASERESGASSSGSRDGGVSSGGSGLKARPRGYVAASDVAVGVFESSVLGQAAKGHSAADKRLALLHALALRKLPPDRSRAAVAEILRGARVWDPVVEWERCRPVLGHKEVREAAVRTLRMITLDFDPARHVPREAGQQMPGLDWPESATDFEAWVMLGLCHASAALQMAIMTAAYPHRKWRVLAAPKHALVVALDSGHIVDFAAALVGEHRASLPGAHPDYKQNSAKISLSVVLEDVSFSVFDSTEKYLRALEAAQKPHLRRKMPPWARGPCPRAEYQELARSGQLDHIFKEVVINEETEAPKGWG